MATTTAAALQSILERVEAAIDAAAYQVDELPGGTDQDAALFLAVSLLHDALLTVCDFYNQRISELQHQEDD